MIGNLLSSPSTHEYHFTVKQSGYYEFYIQSDTANWGWSSAWLKPVVYQVSGSQRQNLTVTDTKFSQCQLASSRQKTIYCSTSYSYVLSISGSDTLTQFPYTIRITPPNGGGGDGGGGGTTSAWLSLSSSSASKSSASATGSFSVSANVSWTAKSDSSWLTISSGASGSGNGTVSYKVSANTSTSSRIGYISVSYVSGIETFKVTQSGATVSKPDLYPYQPSGWDAPLVVSTSSTATKSDTSFKDTDTIYVLRAVKSADKAVGSFDTYIYVDGVKKVTMTTDSLSANYYVYNTKGASLGKLSAGSHTIKMVADAGKAISESNENNNEYSKKITVKATAGAVFPKLQTSGYTLSAGLAAASDECLLGTLSGWAVTATGLPDGMLYNAGKRKFVGVPHTTGRHVVMLTATKGSQTVTVKVPITIKAMPATLVGTFEGFASADGWWIWSRQEGYDFAEELPDAMLYPFSLTVLSSANLSATLGSTKFTADRWSSLEDGVYSAVLKSSSGAKLNLEVDPLLGWVNVTAAGEYETKKAALAFYAYRNPFIMKDGAYENSRVGKYVDALYALGTCKLAIKKLCYGEFSVAKTKSTSQLTVKVSKKGVATVAGTLSNESVSGTATVRFQKMPDDDKIHLLASVLMTSKKGRKWLVELDFGTGVAPKGKLSLVK